MKYTLRMEKAAVYGMAIAVGLLAPMAGDALHANILNPAPVVAKALLIPINPDDWQSLARAVQKRASQFGGVSGYVIEDFSSGRIVSYNEGEIFPSASLIKLPILCAAFQAIQEGKFSLNTLLTLERADKRGGSGILKLSPNGTVISNRELLEAMIIHSDNTAAYLIVRQLGFDYLQQTFVHLGLQDTRITPEGFQLTNRQVAEDNLTSPRDMALLLEKIYQRQLVSPDASDQMLTILKHQKLHDRLPKFMPPVGFEIAHKTGLLRKSCHDVGIVFSPKGDYMICVLTSHDATYKTAKRFIASLGRITFDYYQGTRHNPIMQTRKPTADDQA